MEERQSCFTQHETRNPHPERFSLHSFLVGNGDPVLCLSGFGCDSYNYEWMWPSLARRSNLVLLDNRGMGQSGPVTKPYAFAELAEDALQTMLQLGHARFHVIGISMGGMIAQLIALHAPERVLSLALLCTTSAGDRFLPLPPFTAEVLRKATEIPEPQRTDLTLRALVHPNLIAEAPSVFAKMADLRRAHQARLDQLLLQKSAIDQFLAGRIPIEDITAPTLVLQGAQDRFVPPENARRLAALIPNSRLNFVPECDHYFFLEKAEEVASLINAFHHSVREVPA